MVMLEPRTCADEDCGKLFRPLLPQRLYCYDPECKARRVARNNRIQMDRVKRLKKEGKWVDHLRHMTGTGTGSWRKPKESSVGLTRKCLKCDRWFEVPALADDHICHDCHLDNDELLAEYSEEALGLSSIPPTSTVREYEGAA